MRTIDELIDDSAAVLHKGICSAGNHNIEPLLSGGHDSIVATHIATQHPNFTGRVNHIDTGIGSQYTRGFVERLCESQGWNLKVWKSPSTYEMFVRERGFPGPAMHQWAYIRLKERCVRMITKGKAPRVLVNGCRSAESVRRMGHVQPVKVGETNKEGKVSERKRIWTAVCHDWSKAEQQLYMDEFGLPVNKLKVSLGMSGECFCGAFAAPGEREAIKEHAPDVELEIQRLTVIAKECGKHCVWGTRPPKDKAKAVESGPLCSSCDRRAGAAGLMITK